jgi:redox-sensing transcriptional repressor
MTDNSRQVIPAPTLNRLPIYYRRLKDAIGEGTVYVSSAELGRSAGVPPAQVRKDFSYLSQKGRPGVGYEAAVLASHLGGFLGLVETKEAVLVGAGNLGQALALYPGFPAYGLQIVALFDNDPGKVGQGVGGRTILPVKEMGDLVRRRSIRIGIVTTPAAAAQEVADEMVEAGVKAIWNFAPESLEVPGDVFVKNEDLAAELAVLSHHVNRMRISAEEEAK